MVVRVKSRKNQARFLGVYLKPVRVELTGRERRVELAIGQGQRALVRFEVGRLPRPANGGSQADNRRNDRAFHIPEPGNQALTNSLLTGFQRPEYYVFVRKIQQRHIR